MSGPDAARGLEPAEPRQPHLGDDQVGAQPQRLADERVTLAHVADHGKVRPQDDLQAFPKEGMGVCQQHTGPVSFAWTTAL